MNTSAPVTRDNKIGKKAWMLLPLTRESDKIFGELMNIQQTGLTGVLIVQPDVFHDRRGCFMESFNEKKYRESGICDQFVQDNHSHSIRGTIRGLHYQHPHDQAKLVYVVRGTIFDVALDIRFGSPQFGRWTATILSAENKRQIYIPEGFGHGFCVLSENADVIYKCTDFYSPPNEGGINWADPFLGIDWPVREPLLSDKDGQYPCLNDIPVERLPAYEARK